VSWHTVHDGFAAVAAGAGVHLTDTKADAGAAGTEIGAETEAEASTQAEAGGQAEGWRAGWGRLRVARGVFRRSGVPVGECDLPRVFRTPDYLVLQAAVRVL